MRIFKYWKHHEKEVFIDNESFYFKVIGGSNTSENDTKQDAERKMEALKLKIEGKNLPSEYEADIQEEIIHIIDDKNIVTRNRYGALVLNSENLMFIDIDEPRFSFWNLLFNRSLSKKEILYKHIEKTIRKSKYALFGFRLYETTNGYRLLVSNQNFKAQSEESKKIMVDFHVDRVYLWLCVKQNCYRARLTPKPFRIKQKAIKVKYPEEDIDYKIKLSNWISEYEKKSSNFATCKLVKTYGKPIYDKAISYHDRMTKINRPKKLA